MKKALLIIISMLTLCGCEGRKEPEETDYSLPVTESISETSVSASVSETVPDMEFPAEEFPPAIEDIPSENTQAVTAAETVPVKEIKENELTLLNENDLRITGNGEECFEILESVKSARYITILNCTDVPRAAELIKNAGDIGLLRLNITTETYSPRDAETLFKALPTVIIDYEQMSDKWSEGAPKDGFVYYADPLVSLTYPYASPNVTCTFENMTDKRGHISDLRIKCYWGGFWQPVTLSDGSKRVEIDRYVEGGESYSLCLSDDIFDVSQARCGRYKTVCTMSLEGEYEYLYESEFMINCFTPRSPMTEKQEEFYRDNYADERLLKAQIRSCNSFGGVPDFLTEEQLLGYNDALWVTWTFFGLSHGVSESYAASHTADDLLDLIYDGYTKEHADKSTSFYIDKDGSLNGYAADRGGNIFFKGLEFQLIYSDEKELIFCAEILYYHSDNPYFVWYGAKNFHMVNTPDGWRADVFELWV